MHAHLLREVLNPLFRHLQLHAERVTNLWSDLVQPVNERLRTLGGTAKLALDLLEYDSSLERAFLTVCGYVLRFSATLLLRKPFRTCWR
jgi:hypothetical protein